MRIHIVHERFWNCDIWILHPFLWLNCVYWTPMSNSDHPMQLEKLYIGNYACPDCLSPQKDLPMTWCLTKIVHERLSQRKRKILSIFAKFLEKIELLSHQITLRNAKQKVDFVYLFLENWSNWECQTSFSEIRKYLTKQWQRSVKGEVLYHHIYFTIMCCVLLIWWPTLIRTIIFYHLPFFTSM
jgi:hypothetical protein